MSHFKINPIVVYISIGNTDNKLTQELWSQYWSKINTTILDYAYEIYGVWLSESNSPYQNACFAAEFDKEEIEELRNELINIKEKYNQESIAWAVIPETEFI